MTFMRDTLQRLAPGTDLRDGLERIKRGNTGALIVLGDGPEVADVCDGGIEFDVPFTPTLLRELSKMDGAVILSDDAARITRANVQLVPSPTFPTSETGTRHRAAERTALHTGVPVVSVSASMNIVTVYADGKRHVIEEPVVMMTRARQAIATVEQYRSRVDKANQRLSVAEINRYATVEDVLHLLQRQLLLQRAARDVDDQILELGTDARQLRLQLSELRGTICHDISMLVCDYLVADGAPSNTLIDDTLSSLDLLPDPELLNTSALASTLGLPATEENLMEAVTPRGYRALTRIPRVQKFLIDHIVAEFGDLDAIRAADAEELAQAENVSPLWARHIVEGLRRFA
ncbi:DNA integrity scanning diadenylate cyclase DisA [Corynebacterium urinipleomorphum]|uniref:DNA integrity scanning diadenylate cyclase DisA n=1 Tax=Corynebacterium urinipleomorphum TaxID=1852380 RepID=UPI000B3540CF|nr:DNA integrity scanning diadenylate cyclase DisA [Corynebacterium urinipleomorphum]